MTYGSESECAIHYTAAPHMFVPYVSPLYNVMCHDLSIFTFHVVQNCNCINASSYDYHLTTSSEINSVHSILYQSFFLSSQHTLMSNSRNIFISLLILLSGYIQSNPRPVTGVSSPNMCSLNIRSFTDHLHYSADLVTHNTLMSLFLQLLGFLPSLPLLY